MFRDVGRFLTDRNRFCFEQRGVFRDIFCGGCGLFDDCLFRRGYFHLCWEYFLSSHLIGYLRTLCNCLLLNCFFCRDFYFFLRYLLDLFWMDFSGFSLNHRFWWLNIHQIEDIGQYGIRKHDLNAATDRAQFLNRGCKTMMNDLLSRFSCMHDIALNDLLNP